MERLPPDRQRAIDRAFSNIGKALAAYQRTLLWRPTRFDRYADALADGTPTEGLFTPVEEEGLRLFIGKAGCATCHDGPRFTDDAFHNTGVPAVPGQPLDRGRADAIAKVTRDPFNCTGAFSDAGPDDCLELRFIRSSEDAVRAFRTTSPREIAARAPYMHAGQIGTLAEVVDHYAAAPEAPAGHSELAPLDLPAKDRAALVAFLATLSADEDG